MFFESCLGLFYLLIVYLFYGFRIFIPRVRVRPGTHAFILFLLCKFIEASYYIHAFITVQQSVKYEVCTIGHYPIIYRLFTVTK